MLDVALSDENLGNGCEYLDFLLLVLAIGTNKKDYVTSNIPVIVTELLSHELIVHQKNPSSKSSILTTGKTSMEKPLQRLYLLLHQPSLFLPSTISTSAADVAPFGIFRMKCVQLVLAVLKSNFHALDNELIEMKVISRIVDLFFQYKWNNILHSYVTEIIVTILETKEDFFVLHLLRTCNLIGKILLAQKNEDQEKNFKEDKHVPTRSYMGHIYIVANAIVERSKEHPATLYYFADLHDWKKFLDEKLKKINELQQSWEVPQISQEARVVSKFKGFD